jgi:hypothetical protein
MTRDMSDAETLQKFLDSVNRRRRVGIGSFFCVVGAIITGVAIWSVSTDLDMAKLHDQSLALSTHLPQEARTAPKPTYTAARLSLRMALHVANGAVGLVMICTGIALLIRIRTNGSRALEVLARVDLLSR